MTRRFSFVLVTALLATLPALSISGVPSVINYQGRLTDSGGNPVSITTGVEFSIYSVPTGGTPLWTETRSVTPDALGNFSILLGQAVPLHDSVFNSVSRWLGVKIGTDPELTPRTFIASAAYAFRISTIDGSTGGTVSGDVLLLSSGTGSGLGVRDPGGNIGGYHPTTAFFSDNSGDTLAQIGTQGLQFVDPTFGDTILNYDPFLSSLEIGLDNSVTGTRSFAIGTTNGVAGSNAFALGTSNTVSFDNAFALGTDNVAGGQNVFVGGASNQASGTSSSVVAGENNLVTASYSAIGGGTGNIVRGERAVLGGGFFNVAGTNGAVAIHAVVGGGIQNLADGQFAPTVAGGDNNKALGSWSTVGGGSQNTASGSGATVSGGNRNMASGGNSCVTGGSQDTASGSNSAVLGGTLNVASGSGAIALGGAANRATESNCLAAGRNAQSIHSGSFVWADGIVTPLSTTASNQFVARAIGGFYLYTNGSSTAGAQLTPGSGSWSSVSDSTVKRAREVVNPDDVLKKLAEIPITKWSYESQPQSVRHIGPMAQDFYAAFEVGEDDRHITTVDADGVALAAIQALYTRNQELEETVASLQDQIAEIQARLADGQE